jgi:Flp pilus assembly protein TadG
MQNCRNPHPCLATKTKNSERRSGNIVVLSVVFIVAIFGFTAFAVDIGYISLTKTQLQSAADSAALAAAFELTPALGYQGQTLQTQVTATAKQAAVSVAALNPAGESASVYVNSNTDVAFGRRTWNAATGTWNESWNTQPYNMVKVTANRGRGTSTSPDAPLPLFFAPVINNSTAEITVNSTAALVSGVGFQLASSSTKTAPLLPIAYDDPSWSNLMAGVGNDNYSYNPVTGAVTAGADGIKEIDLYPYGNQSLTPGNRGTVDIGSPNNSTADLARQIRYGVNAADLAYFGGSLRTDLGPIQLNGDTGLSAGIKDDLAYIIGQPRAIPIFTAVSGPGNNAMYTINKFVGIRIMYVKLTGGNKTVVAQPAVVMDGSILVGPTTSATQYIFGTPRIIH